MPLLSYLMACGHGGSVAVDCAFRWARHDGRVVRACTGAMEGVSAVTSVGGFCCVDVCRSNIMSGVKSDSGVQQDWAMHGIKYRSLGLWKPGMVVQCCCMELEVMAHVSES